MFNPSREEVRRFFCEAWRKRRAGELVTPLEATALKWIDRHPETHALLDDPEQSLRQDFSIAGGDSNPFLHLSMHLAIEEQLSIDQPPGIKTCFEHLARRFGGEHEAMHQTMECLGRVLWETQRGTLPQDTQAINDAYLTCLQQRATRAART
jgi:Domain of unknown function (DUF1841)